MTKANKKLTDNGTKLASQTSLQLLPLIMQNIPQAVFWKDQNLVYLGCNRAFAEDAGFASPEDVIGKTDFDMPWKDQAEAYRADDRRVLDSGESKLNYEEPQTTPNGSTIWLSTSKIPVCDDGKVVAILGMYEDITERKEIEVRFRRFTEATNEALIFHEHGKIVDVNPAALVMFGFEKEADVIGTNLLEFVAPESRVLVTEKMQLGDVPPYEAVCVRTDKTTFPIETRTRSYRFGDRFIRATSVRDITQRKKAEAQVQQEKSFSDAIINALPSTFYMFDIQGKMLRWNEQYEKESGYTAEDMQTISVIDTLAEDSRENALAAIQQALVEGQGAVEASFITKDGRTVPYYFAGRRLQIGDQTLLVGTGMNLTERKQAEAQLQQEKSLSDAIINGLPGTFYLFDTQGKLIRWNKQYEQVLGYTTEETAARNAIDPIAEEDRENTTAAIQQTFVEGQGSVEASFVTKDGRRIPYYFVGQRIQLGDQLYLAGTGIDITERRKLEEQIQTAFERRGLQVQLSTQVSQSIAAAASLEDLYERVVTQVKEQFGYYHTQLLRYDEVQDAVVLVTGYGETGAKMLAAGHRMPMGEGLIGTAASTGETILRSDLANDPDWHPNPLLPETKGEIAVPIKLGDTILGVLDVQSSAAGALGADDQLLLEGLCGQIATAIEGTRLRQEMAEQAERDILLRDRALASSLNAVLVVGLDFKPIYVNESFLKMTGYTYEEAMHLTITDISGDPEGLEQISEATNRQGFFVGEEPIKRKDGSIFPSDFSTSYITDDKGKPIAIQTAFVDISERKKAEVQLQQEKSFSDTIINGLPGTFYLFDLQGKMIRWNRQYEIVSGYTSEEIPMLSVADSIAEEDRERVAATIQRAFMEGQATVEANIINRDGRRTPYYLTGQRLQIGDQIYLVGTGVDITERKQAERALRESQQFLQTIMDNIPQSIFWKDNNLIYLGCNSAFAADTGLTTPSDVVGKTDWDMPWKDQAEAYRADDSLVIKNGVPKLNYEEPQTTPEGRTSWLRTSKIPLYDIDGKAFAVLGMYEDITERKLAEERVRTSREQLLNIINFLPDATLVTDKDRKVVAWNRALEEMTGIKSEEIVGKGDYAYSVPFYGDARPMLVDFAMEHSEIAERYEGIQRQGDRLSAEVYVSSVYQGRGGYLLAIASPLYDANGNIIGAIEAIRDVTERKQLELQVQEAFERRGLQVQLSTQISQSIASAASLEELYERVVTQVKEQFGYYHTQLLRYDEAQDAVVLITGYGETGAKMLAAGHRMPMGEGLIGTAASNGETILRSDLANDPDWHPNPLLPETKGEIAVPIKLGDTILGVLDVQSSTAGALGADDQLLLEGLCGQIATAIEGTRLRQEMAERLEEVNRLYRAMSHEGWKTYRETTDIPSSFVYDQAGLRPAKDIDLTEELFANVPLAIPGGEVIGTLAVADDPQRPITPEDETFLQQVSEQLALALESARLFEQTQTALVSVRESQAALDEAMNVANMTNWEYDLTTHELTVGERLFTMLGTSVEEFHDSGLTATQYIQKFEHPEDRGVVEKSLQDAAQSLDPKNFFGRVEFRILHKDGQTRYMSSSYRVRTDEQGTPLTAIGSWLDITERKKAELAIQESQAALEEVMNVAGMANWQLSFETFTFTYNDRLYRMLGTTAEEEGGYEMSAEKYVSKYIHPDDAALIMGAIQEGLQSPDPQNFKGSLEYRMIRKDGQIRYMLTDYRLIVNKEGKPIAGVGSFLDITERKTAELAVAKRASELATVAEVGTTTAATLEPDRLLQSVVDLAKEQFGLYHAHIYTYDESWSTLLLAAGAGEVGRKLVAEEHAIPMSLEQSLVARAARERKAIIVNDVINEPGFLPNPLLPDTRAEMAVPMTAGDKLLGVFDVQSSNLEGFSQEDANIYVTLASQVAVALQNARMYVEQAALVTQLRELDRLKSSFLANMSHELRTPLNSILGFADVIIEGLDGPLTENMSNDLRLIQKNGQHLLHLINDVLDMSKIEAGRMNLSPETFKVVEVLDEVTSITSTLASEKNLALFIEEESDNELSIYADRTRLRQVMINLVNNSIKFTENGKISLKVAPLEGARVLITVKDTGIGIPPDKLEVIFQEFTQVDSSTTRKAGGTGLGLPISRRLIEMHGGRVWAESTGVNGEGSTFFVEMPIEARITEVIEKQAK